MMKLLAAKDLIGHDITSKSDPYAKISGRNFSAYIVVNSSTYTILQVNELSLNVDIIVHFM